MAEFSLQGKKVWVAGHRGMVGSAIVRRLESEDCSVLTATRQELNLLRQTDVEAWMADHKPDAVFLAAATVGGILANDSRPADFLYDNLTIESNIIHGAHVTDVGKLLFLGSSCIYPRDAAQPLTEESLLTGPLEPTNQWYAVAKIAGIKLCQAYRLQHRRDFISVMPTNLYGPGDNFDLQSSHVLPAFIRKIHQAKTEGQPSVEIWGSGTPKREFLHVDDLADACVHLMRTYSDMGHINVGVGEDIAIRDLARLIADVIGYEGEFHYDSSKPDGTPRKLLDVSTLAGLGWRSRIGLRDGLAATYRWYLDNVADA